MLSMRRAKAAQVLLLQSRGSFYQANSKEQKIQGIVSIQSSQKTRNADSAIQRKEKGRKFKAQIEA
jgi:hypothetical protein